ncbi:MAG: methyltransferase domain-containing protein [Candidatus Peregrinibacteria bacterium]
MNEGPSEGQNWEEEGCCGRSPRIDVIEGGEGACAGPTEGLRRRSPAPVIGRVARLCGFGDERPFWKGSEEMSRPEKDSFERSADRFPYAQMRPVPVWGKPFSEVLSSLDSFCDCADFCSHRAAGENIGRVLGKPICDEDALSRLLRKIPESAFHSSRIRPDLDVDERREEVKRVIALVARVWREDEGRIFMGVEGWEDHEVGYSVQAAARCPRFLGGLESIEGLGISKEWLSDPQTAVELQRLYMLAKRKALSAKDGWHRQAYIVAQIAMVSSRAVGSSYFIPSLRNSSHFLTDDERPERDVEVLAPSLRVFREDEDKENIRTYLYSMLSLLFPDDEDMTPRQPDFFNSILVSEGGNLSSLVQEEFILYDLTALSKRHGLYEEFKEYFLDICRYRRVQFVSNFHLDPLDPTFPGRYSIKDVLDYFQKSNGRAATLASIGCDDGFLEILLQKSGYIDSWKGVDIDYSREKDRDFDMGENGKITLIGVKEEAQTNRRRIDGVFEAAGRPDVVIMGDVAHETEDPRQYIIRAYESLNPGGYLVIVDPLHCRAVDRVSAVTVYPCDDTRYPESMLDLADYFELNFLFERLGAKVVQVSQAPIGHNDPFWRVSIIIKKPDKEDDVAYALGESKNVNWNDELQADDDIFKVWPLSCIKDSREREIVLSKIHERIGGNIADINMSAEDGGARKLKFSELKSKIIGWLLPREAIESLLSAGEISFCEGDGFYDLEGRAAERLAFDVSPYGPVIDRIMNELRRDLNLRNLNHFAGEVIALAGLLKNMGIDVGIDRRMIKRDES